MQEKTESNKRMFQRLPLSAPVRYQLKGSQRFSFGVGRDISDNGIGLVSNEFLPIAQQLIFEVRHPENQKCIRVLGQIVWVSNERYSERYLLGASFIELPTII